MNLHVSYASDSNAFDQSRNNLSKSYQTLQLGEHYILALNSGTDLLFT